MWDITLSTNPPVLKLPRVPTDKVGSVPGDKTYQGQHESDEDSEDDPLEPIARPKWSMGQVHIIKQNTTPYLDGYSQRLFPQNKRSNWEGAWLPDGPPGEVFSAVIST